MRYTIQEEVFSKLIDVVWDESRLKVKMDVRVKASERININFPEFNGRVSDKERIKNVLEREFNG